MNKKTAQEQLTALQVEIDKLKVIINTPEVKTGRVLSMGDLELNAKYWVVYTAITRTTMDNDSFDKARIETGSAFHDKETAERYLTYLKLEQELRIAQAADSGAGLGGKRYTIALYEDGSLFNEVVHSSYAKISFNRQAARSSFRMTHTDEQLKLLIRGV